MKRRRYLLLLSFAATALAGQNLVQNPGFEAYTTCPTNVSNFNGYVDQWYTTAGSPDYYNTCGFSGSATTTNSIPARTGNGFVGFFQYGYWPSIGVYEREYIHSQLSAPLVAGRVYQVEFYVHPVVVDVVGISFAIDQLSMYVSPAPVTALPPSYLLSVPAQVTNPNGPVTSVNGWTRISGCFTAAGGEEYFVIGNFQPDALTQTAPLPGATNPYLAYYLIDDVSLTEVTFPELPADTTLCEGQTLLLDMTAPGATYSWQDNSTAPTFTAGATGVYWVDVTIGGCTRRDSLTAQFNSLPRVSFSDDTMLCYGNGMLLDVTEPNATYCWHDNSVSPQFFVDTSGLYWVTVTNSCGSRTDSVSVDYRDCGCTVYLPNAFTPNANGLNDEFRAVYECTLYEFELLVFDRWGMLLFKTTDPGRGWDGSFSGRMCQPDTYAWKLRYRGDDNGTPAEVTRYGSVHLIR